MDFEHFSLLRLLKKRKCALFSKYLLSSFSVEIPLVNRMKNLQFLPLKS